MDNNVIIYIAKPSAEEANRIKRMEAQRLEKRRHELGDVKLKELQRQVEAAKEECDRPVPATVLNSFPLIEVSIPADFRTRHLISPAV